MRGCYFERNYGIARLRYSISTVNHVLRINICVFYVHIDIEVVVLK